MTSPTPLQNIIFGGFFTTDLTAINTSSITSIPQHFAAVTQNSNGNLGIITNVYIQDVNICSDSVSSSFTQVTDNLNIPIVLSFYNNFSNPFVVNNVKSYENNVSLNINQVQSIVSNNYETYPTTSYLFDINSLNTNIENYIKEKKYINFQFKTPQNYSSISIQSQFEYVPGNIQIDIGYGNIQPGWVNNTYTIYNPFLPNSYNGQTSTGNSLATCWIIYSTDY